MQFFGVDPLKAGNVVQLVMVLGLTIGWISTYIFRVSNKEMTYAQQLRDYESKVMEVYPRAKLFFESIVFATEKKLVFIVLKLDSLSLSLCVLAEKDGELNRSRVRSTYGTG